jgi:hypothetical protein
MLIIAALFFAQPQPFSVPPPHCWEEVVEDGVKAKRYRGDRVCVDFGPVREIAGIWVDQFEGSRFYEGARDLDEVRKREDKVWLEIDEASVVPAEFKRPGYSHAYHVTFTGRTARDMNRKPMHGYGHLGVSSGLALVDRFTSWKDLGHFEN